MSFESDDRPQMFAAAVNWNQPSFAGDGQMELDPKVTSSVHFIDSEFFNVKLNF